MTDYFVKKSVVDIDTNNLGFEINFINIKIWSRVRSFIHFRATVHYIDLYFLFDRVKITFDRYLT